MHLPETALDWHLHDYVLSVERQARSLFQVKIGLAGLTVKSKATELNSKARTTESKKF